MIKHTSENTTESEKECIKILITTEKHLITGNLFTPIPSGLTNPTHDNLLFYELNCGNKFIQLHECIISNKDSIEYKPQKVDCYNINLDIVHSCQIIKED